MNVYYQTLVACIHQDASGEAVLFPDFPPAEDSVWQCLIAPSQSDSTTQEIFFSQPCFLGYYVIIYVPGEVYHNPCTRLQTETKSEPKTKVYSRSLCTQEIHYNFAVLQPISKFQSPVDFSLRVGSIYMQRERGTLTLPKLAECPIKKV